MSDPDDFNFGPDDFNPEIPRGVQYVVLDNFRFTVYLTIDGCYKLPTKQVAACIDKKPPNINGFLNSSKLKELRGDSPGYEYWEQVRKPAGTPGKNNDELEKVTHLDIAVLYWLYVLNRDYQQRAFHLLAALATTALEQQFDKAFNELERADIYTARTAARISDYRRIYGPVKPRIPEFEIWPF